jgi:hypothetical protein
VTIGIEASDRHYVQTDCIAYASFGQTRIDARLRVTMPDRKRPAKVSGKKRKAPITATGAWLTLCNMHNRCCHSRRRRHAHKLSPIVRLIMLHRHTG